MTIERAAKALTFPAAVAVLLSLLTLFGYICFILGQADMRQHTIVKVGHPYYGGVYFGTCWWHFGHDGVRDTEACATDERQNETDIIIKDNYLHGSPGIILESPHDN